MYSTASRSASSIAESKSSARHSVTRSSYAESASRPSSSRNTHLTLYQPIEPTPRQRRRPLSDDTSGKPSADVQELLGLGRVAGGRRALLGFGEGVAGVLLPPGLALGGEGVDRVVVLVGAVQGLGVLLLDAGAVVLLPVRDAADLVVLRQLVHPALPDIR